MGSIFSAYDIRGRIGETLTVEYAWAAGKAFAEWLSVDGPVVIATAKDGNSEIVHAFVEGVLLQGRDVIDYGEKDQLVASDLSESKAAGAVLVSHDGVQNLEIITLCDAYGVTITAETGLTEISNLIDANTFLPAVTKGQLITTK